MKSAFIAVVSGRVQLVMYRDFVKRKADALSVVGEVKNMDDGTVRVVAEGERDKLDQLLTHLHRGPFLAKVKEIKVQWKEPSSSFDGFSIRYS